MATKRNSFILHLDSLVILEKMTDEQAGKFIKSIYKYKKTNIIPTLNFGLDMAITPFINQFKRDEGKYQNIVERNKKNGSKGGRPKKPKKPTGLSGNPSKPKKADSDSKSDNDNKNVNKNKKEEYGLYKNIILSDEEYKKLSELYKNKLEEAFEMLSVWKNNKNKKNTHNYGTLLKSQWVYKKVFETKQNNSFKRERNNGNSRNL